MSLFIFGQNQILTLQRWNSITKMTLIYKWTIGRSVNVGGQKVMKCHFMEYILLLLQLKSCGRSPPPLWYRRPCTKAGSNQVWHWSPSKLNLSLTKSFAIWRQQYEIWALWSGLLMCSLINVGLKSLSGYEDMYPKKYYITWEITDLNQMNWYLLTRSLLTPTWWLKLGQQNW